MADVVEPAPLPLPLPPAPPGTDPDKAMFAASICAAAYLDKSVGCRSHPPFVRPEQRPDGKFLEHTGDPLLFCAIGEIFRGSFSKPGAKQAIVSFGQCKESADAMWNSGFPGSAVLVEEIDGRWKAIGFEPEVNLGYCMQNRRADGRDVLVCRSGFGAPPSGQVTYFFSVDFARRLAGKSGARTFARAFSDSPLCGFLDEGLPTGLAHFKVVDMKLRHLDKDGTQDVVVKVERSKSPPSPALVAKVRAACKRDPNLFDPRPFVPPPKVVSLEFVSFGDVYIPAPATQKLLDAWTADSPDGMNGMSKVGPPDGD